VLFFPVQEEGLGTTINVALSRQDAGATKQAGKMPTLQNKPEASSQPNVPYMAVLGLVLFLLVLLVVLLVGSMIIMGWGKRYRLKQKEQHAPPTPVTDIWSMHVLEEDTQASGSSDDHDAGETDH